MEEQHIKLIFDHSRANTLVLYDLNSAGASHPPLWNAPGERNSWPTPEHALSDTNELLSERIHEVGISILNDGDTLLHIFTYNTKHPRPPGSWDFQVSTTISCPSGKMGVRHMTGEAQGTLHVSTQRLKVFASGRHIHNADSEYLQEYVIQVWPENSSSNL